MTENEPRIFLCHAHEDKPRVKKLYHQLKAAGYHPWLDEEDLLPGQDWWSEIKKVITDPYNLVVVCLSNNSVTKRGVVQREIKRALDVLEEMPEDSIYLIPARLEECQVPERLSGLHWVDLFEPNGFEKLKEALDFEISRRPALDEGENEQSGQIWSWGRLRLPLAVAGLLALVVGVVAIALGTGAGNPNSSSKTSVPVIDTQEVSTETQDTDGDGMPDSWEEEYGLDPTVDDALGDRDDDGISNLEEFNNNTNPNVAEESIRLLTRVKSFVATGGAAETKAKVECPTGMVAIGGGFDPEFDPESTVNYLALGASAPVFSQKLERLTEQPDGQATAPTGWQVSVMNNDYNANSFKVGVVCAEGLVNETSVGSMTVAPESIDSIDLSCPPGTAAIGGGLDADWFALAESWPEPGYISSAPTFSQSGDRLIDQTDGDADAPTGWRVAFLNKSQSPMPIKAAVMCTHRKIDALIESTLIHEKGMEAVRLKCPPGTTAVSGGVDMKTWYSDEYFLELRSFAPTFGESGDRLFSQPTGPSKQPSGWLVNVYFDGGIDEFLDVKAVVLCIEQ